MTYIVYHFQQLLMLSIDAQCCSILSFTGIVFLTIMGYLLQVQPLYIKGVNDNIAAAKGCYEGGEIMMMRMMIMMIMLRRMMIKMIVMMTIT